MASIILATLLIGISVFAAYLNVEADNAVERTGGISWKRPDNANAVQMKKNQVMAGWFITTGILIVWLFISPSFLGDNYFLINLVVIPTITLFLPILWPVKPLSSVAIIALIYAIFFISLPISSGINTTSGYLNVMSIFIAVVIIIVNSGALYWLCYSHRREGM